LHRDEAELLVRGDDVRREREQRQIHAQAVAANQPNTIQN
jgi:hypothetical protein